MDFVIVGDENCKFEDIANLVQKFPVVYKDLEEVFLQLNLHADLRLKIRNKFEDRHETFFHSIIRGLKAWRADTGKSSTLSKLVFAFQLCGLSDIAAAMKSTFNPEDSATKRNTKFGHVPEAVNFALQSTAKMVVIKTTSQKLLYKLIKETVEENIILIDELEKFSNYPNSFDKIFIVMDNLLDLKTLEKIKKLGQKIVLLTEQGIQNDILSACDVIIHQLHWKDFTKHYQEILINKHFLIGQRQTTLSLLQCDINPNELNNILSDTFLTNLVAGTAQLFPLRLPPELNYYIGRKLVPRNRINNDVFKDKTQTTFIFTGLSRLKLSQRTQPNISDISTNQILKEKLDAKYIHLVQYSDFMAICKKAEAEVHWLHHDEEDNLAWVASKATMSKIQDYVVTSNIEYSENEFIDFIEIEQKPFLPKNSILISDNPGTGKSVLLAKLARTVSKKYPDRITIFINLEEFIKTMANRKDLFEAFVKKVCDDNKLSEAILRSISSFEGNISKSVVELFIDGFDEIDVKDINVAETLLQTIRSKFTPQKVRLWITTRPHLVHTLENLLNVLSCSIKPFTNTEKLRVLKIIWTDSANFFGKTLDQSRLKLYGEGCLSAINDTLCERENDIAGIPLQCLLIAEAYVSNAIEYCQLSNMIDNHFIPAFNIRNLSDLYDNLIKTKFEKHRRRKLIKNNIDLLKEIDNELRNLHDQLGFLEIFPDIFSSLRFGTQLLNKTRLHDLCKIGILESSSHVLVPSFLHRTFAEYFTASYVVDTLLNNCEKFDIKILQTIFKTAGDAKLSTDRHTLQLHIGKVSFHESVVCYFIENLLLNKGKQGTKVPLLNVETDMYPFLAAAISENCIQLFQMFTGNSKWTNYIVSDNSFDEEGETRSKTMNLLYLAVRYSHVNFVCSVLQDFGEVYKNLPDVPNLETITLLHVAVKFREFDVVSELVDKWYTNLQRLDDLVHFCISDTENVDTALIDEKINILHLICFKCSNLINSKHQGLAPLHLPNVHPRLESKLLDLGADINVLTDASRETILHTHMRSASHIRKYFSDILLTDQRKQECRELVLKKDTEGFTPLHRYVINLVPELKTIKMFHDLNADFSSENIYGESIIASTIMNHQDVDGIRSLIEFGAKIDWKSTTGKNLYHLALFKGNISVFKVLTKRGLSVNMADEEGNTPLHNLMRDWNQNPREIIASFLVEHDASISLFNKQGFTPLDYCLSNRTVGKPILSFEFLKTLHSKHNGKVSIMNLILQALILSTTDEISIDCLNLAKEIVKNGADLTYKTNDGRSLLFLAMELACIPTIQWLVDSGLQVNSENVFGDTPLHYLMSIEKENHNGELEVLSYMQSCGALLCKRNFENLTVMDIAVTKENFIFAEVCKQFNDISVCKNLVTKTLHNLALSVNYPQGLEIIEALIKHSYGVNQKDNTGNTLLHHAVQRRSIEWTEYYLSIGASSQIGNKERRLPIHMLHHLGLIEYKNQPYEELIQLLLPKEQNSLIGIDHWIKFHTAVGCGDKFKLHLDAFLADNEFFKFLFCDAFVWYVLGCRSIKVISLYCEAYKLHGFNLTDLGTSKKKSALHVAVNQGDSAVVEYLLEEQGFSEALTSGRMRNLIHALVINSNLKPLNMCKKILKLLLTRNKDLVNTDYKGSSPLLVDNIHPKLIKLLLQYGADVAAVNKHGDNLAHLAVQYLKPDEYCSLVKLLLRNGHCRLFQAEGKDGCTVLHRVVIRWAKLKDFIQTVNILKKCGANFNGVDQNGQSVLVYAVKSRRILELNVILELIKHGCLWNTLFAKKVSKNETISMLKCLIHNGVDIAVKDVNGDCIATLVHYHLCEEKDKVLHIYSKKYGNVNEIEKMYECIIRQSKIVSHDLDIAKEMLLEKFKSIISGMKCVDEMDLTVDEHVRNIVNELKQNEHFPLDIDLGTKLVHSFNNQIHKCYTKVLVDKLKAHEHHEVGKHQKGTENTVLQTPTTSQKIFKNSNNTLDKEYVVQQHESLVSDAKENVININQSDRIEHELPNITCGHRETCIKDSSNLTQYMKMLMQNSLSVDFDTDELAIGIDIGNSRCCLGFFLKGKFNVFRCTECEHTYDTYITFNEDGPDVIGKSTQSSWLIPERGISNLVRMVGQRFDSEPVVEIRKCRKFIVGMDDNFSTRINIGTEFYSPEDILRIIFKNMSEQVNKYFGRFTTNMVITVPSTFNPSQVEAIKLAFEQNSLQFLDVLSSAEAAVISYKLSAGNEDQRNILVYDFGQTSCCVSLVQVTSGNMVLKGVKEDLYPSGKNIDEKLVTFVVEKLKRVNTLNLRDVPEKLIHLGNICRKVKHELSEDDSRHAKVTCDEIYNGLNVDVTVSIEEFEVLIEPICQRSLDLISELLTEEGLTPETVDDIVAAGGCTKIPKVKTLLQNFFKEKPIYSSINGETVVAYGAACHAAIKTFSENQ